MQAHADFNSAGAALFNGAVPAAGASLDALLTLANGVGAGQADLLYAGERTVATGANDDVDLSGVLTDLFGGAVAMVKLKGIILINRPAAYPTVKNTTNLTLTIPANGVPLLTGTTPALAALKPGGFFMMGADDIAGLAAVVAATGDLIRITNSAGATAKYLLGLFGTSA